MLCFAAGCVEEKTGMSKFCSRHRLYFQALNRLSEKSGNVNIHNQIFSDPEKTAKAFAEFEKAEAVASRRSKGFIKWEVIGPA